MEYLKNAKARIDEASELIGRAIGLEKLSTIERDIILDKLAKAYDCLLTARLLSIETASKPLGESLSFKKNTETPAKTIQQNDRPIVEAENLIAEKPTIQDKKVDEKNEKPKSGVQPSNSEIITPKKEAIHKPELDDHTHGEILAEKFQGKHKFRNEIIAEHSTKADMSSKLQNKPIGDLSKAIGINDKFLFIRELFGGDSARYSETIIHLNSFSDLNDAIIYLQDNFDWAEGNDYAAKFIDLVRRKFI